MQIFAISVVKNEADIIAYSLKQASIWADKIFVMDNGSIDGTWQIVNEISIVNKKIIPWKQDFKPFYEGIRGEVYNEFKKCSHDGDWWCYRLDADEIYLDDPVTFLKSVSNQFHCVATDSIEFYLTHEDIRENTFSILFNENINKINYYDPYTWSEMRFFRERKGLHWNPKDDRPHFVGITCPKKIRLKHYQYRSPHQIQLRLDTRREARAKGFSGWGHASQMMWKSKLKSREDLYFASNPWDYRTLGCRNNHLSSSIVTFFKKLFFKLRFLP